ncbi:hypothetical protein ANACOL_03647 [Anaerotruncus colihominis DSM 17241]|uniref:Uncharacterized protein n=1 Tax=Anaerotruncus colihominis DSM 17241 TaxID=445972 RepID=B0PFR5_9FIRM|nr:hypothetical protein ANACOL_03647 [Anaerotruncus colihominis DSM 17241]
MHWLFGGGFETFCQIPRFVWQRCCSGILRFYDFIFCSSGMDTYSTSRPN